MGDQIGQLLEAVAGVDGNQHPEEFLVDPLAHHLVEHQAEIDHLAERRDDLLAAQGPFPVLQGQGHLLRPLLQEVVLQRRLVFQVLFLPAALDLVERRLGDVEIAPLHQFMHLPEEKGEEQRQDVRAVHVGVGHDDDPVVAELGDIEVVLADTGAQGRDQGPDLLGGDHLVEAGLLHVEDLPLEREDRLVFPVPSLLGRAAGRITFHQEQFAERRVLLLAVGQLPRQGADLQCPLAPGEIAGLAGRLPGPGRIDRLLQDPLGHLGVFLQVGGELFVHQGLHVPLDLGVPQLGLGLPLELGLGNLHRDHRGQPLPQVLAGDGHLDVLQQVVGVGVGVHGPGQRRLEADQVGPPLMGVDVVGKGEDLLVIAVVVLHGYFRLHPPLLPFEVDRFRVDGGLVLVEILHEGDDPPFVEELMDLLGPFVGDLDPHPGVQEGHFPQPLGEDVEGKLGGLEDLAVGEEGDLRPPLLGLADHCQRTLRHPAAVRLAEDLAIPANLQLQPLGQGVHYRHADAVETARHLVGGVVEFSAGVEDGEHHFGRRYPFGRMDVGRDAAAVVDHRDRAVHVDADRDVVAVTCQRLVDGVVHDLVDQVVEPLGGGGADVHGRPLPYRRKSLQHLDLVGAVIVIEF